MTPTAQYSITTTYKDQEVVIEGLAYNEPIKRTNEVEIYSIIRFLYTGIPIGTVINFSEELTQEELELEVEDHKEKLNKYIK